METGKGFECTAYFKGGDGQGTVPRARCVNFMEAVEMAINTGRKFIGIEKDEEYYQLANERMMRQIMMILALVLWGQICFGEGTNTGTVTNTGTATKIVGLSPLCPMVMHMLPLSKSLEMEIYPSILRALILLVEGTKDDNVKPILEGLKQSLQKAEMDLESVEKSEKEYEEAKAETKRREEICRRGECEHWKEWRELQEEVEGEGNVSIRRNGENCKKKLKGRAIK